MTKISEQVEITKICSVGLQGVLIKGMTFYGTSKNDSLNVCCSIALDNPSAVAGIILHQLEMVRMPKFYVIFPDEQHMRKALNNLFCWLKFSFFIRNLDRWILKVVSDLQVSHNALESGFICK